MKKTVQVGKLYAINVGYATYGIFVDNDIVVDAPPIAKWMINKTLKEVKNNLNTIRAILYK
jgi:hypothetical protein